MKSQSVGSADGNTVKKSNAADDGGPSANQKRQTVADTHKNEEGDSRSAKRQKGEEGRSPK